MPEQLTQRDLRRNLDRLMGSFSGRDPAVDRSLEATAVSRGIARRLPLSHSTGRAAFLEIAQWGRLLSLEKLLEAGRRHLRHLLGARPVPVEKILETAGFVFTYAGPFRYPETACGLLFRVEVEMDRALEAVATPFDSGATVQYLRPGESEAEQRRFVRSHELPVPGYRALLELFLDQLYDSPWDYLEGREPRLPGPVEVVGGDHRRWTFEVRFRDELGLSGQLLAIFLPVAVATEEIVLERLTDWRREGVDVVTFRTPSDGAWQRLSKLGVAYLQDYLEKGRV